MKRGSPTIGDELDSLTIAQLTARLEETGADVRELIEDDKAAGDKSAGHKKWFRATILARLAEGDEEEAVRAREQVEELDMCPCDAEQNESLIGDVQCPVCRQWWHRECVGANVDLKKWARCENCEQFARLVESKRDSGPV